MPSALSRSPVLSSELLASREPFRDGVYVVGPFAGRVSFSSQQRRAISLVCDIDNDLKTAGDHQGLRNKGVCIVGAGIAGLTCAATVATLGGEAYVYEKQPERSRLASGRRVTIHQILPTIRDAKHRNAHPNLNFWPHEDVDPFTRLPFLNWHEGDCASVAERFAEQLNQLMLHQEVRTRISIRTGLSVRGIRKEDGKFKVDCVASSGSTEPWRRSFDLVILAVGFGDERSAPGMASPSYWASLSGAIPELRKHAFPEIKHYVVSGTGDGGLIEALTMTFGDMQAGNVHPAIADALNDGALRNEIARVENQAHKQYADQVLHGTGEQPSPETRDDLSRFLWKGYEPLVDYIPEYIVTEISRSRSEIASVILLGQWTHPMELSSSPYHRLLTVLSQKKGWIDYRRISEINATSRNPPLRIAADVEVTLADVWVKPHATGAAGYTLENSFFVARHGYSSPLVELYDNPTLIGQIKRQQSLYADQDSLPTERVQRLAGILGYPDPSRTDRFFMEHKRTIEAYFQTRFNLVIEMEAQRSETHFVVYGSEEASAADGIPRVLSAAK